MKLTTSVPLLQETASKIISIFKPWRGRNVFCFDSSECLQSSEMRLRMMNHNPKIWLKDQHRPEAHWWPTFFLFFFDMVAVILPLLWNYFAKGFFNQCLHRFHFEIYIVSSYISFYLTPYHPSIGFNSQWYSGSWQAVLVLFLASSSIL